MQYPAKVLQRHKVLSMVLNGLLNIKQASQELNLSYRQTQRLLKRFLEGDMSIDTLVYKRTHPAWNKLDRSIEAKVIKTCKQYPNINNCHIADLLEEEIPKKIHPSTVRDILIENKLYQPKPQKRRPRKRFEMASFGQLVQMDTSEHFWLPLLGKETSMVALEDDHSRDLLDAELVEHDTTWNNMCLIRRVIEEYGLFQTLYTDNDSMFKLIRSGWSRHFEYKVDLERVQTQIHRSLLELGIGFIHTRPFEPQGKGKLERLFGFMQERLCPVLNKVKNLKVANKIIQNWRSWYNKRVHSITKERPIDRHEPSVFKPLPSDINLDDVFCFKYQRTVKSDNTFSFDNKTYQISQFTNRISYAKAEVELHVLPGRYIRVFYKEQFVQQFDFKAMYRI
ncbi:DDE-type integrase/transposase/recombinase [Candidatus Woesearchaeota archaeon]|nr:DDE-type integrase/transposase/recombinase [Candidatus Woesearchaeota archaeon]